ncbi:hypothetical protein [Pararhodobacter zhoushanensis]|uniref:hypothetical protein n=1 Tax=Pararhodobacter zhoushanensis TaxID=2479545 RepID=UPI000F8EE712|nr:hypothetical protein [Pararhodobacter zhoushanensis]
MEAGIVSAQGLLGSAVGLGLFLLAFMVQRAVLARLDPRTLIGDERDYLAMATGAPVGSVWVRVPLGALPVWIARQTNAADVVRRARLIVSLIASATVGIGGWFACEQAGFAAGLAAGLILLVSAERAVLAIHLWPDTLMGLCLLAFAVAIGAPDSMLWIGALAAVGFLIRVDFTVLAVFAGIHALVAFPGAPGALAAAILPTMLVAAAMALHNKRKHGIWSPDTTFQFNLAVASTEAAFPRAPTQELMLRTTRRVSSGEEGHRDVATTPSPLATALLGFRRLVTLVGKETFVLQKLLVAPSPVYAGHFSPWMAMLVLASTRLWFSVVFIAFVLFSQGIPREILALVACVVFVQSAVQTRSRYRMAVLPVMAVYVAIAAFTPGALPITAGSVVLALCAAVLVIVCRPRDEQRQES